MKISCSGCPEPIGKAANWRKRKKYRKLKKKIIPQGSVSNLIHSLPWRQQHGECRVGPSLLLLWAQLPQTGARGCLVLILETWRHVGFVVATCPEPLLFLGAGVAQVTGWCPCLWPGCCKSSTSSAQVQLCSGGVFCSVWIARWQHNKVGLGSGLEFLKPFYIKTLLSKGHFFGVLHVAMPHCQGLHFSLYT